MPGGSTAPQHNPVTCSTLQELAPCPRLTPHTSPPHTESQQHPHSQVWWLHGGPGKANLRVTSGQCLVTAGTCRDSRDVHVAGEQGTEPTVEGTEHGRGARQRVQAVLVQPRSSGGVHVCALLCACLNHRGSVDFRHCRQKVQICIRLKEPFVI